jgi:hypothetical protein
VTHEEVRVDVTLGANLEEEIDGSLRAARTCEMLATERQLASTNCCNALDCEKEEEPFIAMTLSLEWRAGLTHSDCWSRFFYRTWLFL